MRGSRERGGVASSTPGATSGQERRLTLARIQPRLGDMLSIGPTFRRNSAERSSLGSLAEQTIVADKKGVPGMAIPDVSNKSLAELISLRGRNAVVTGGARGIGLA